jgi:hypothetical protein
LGLADDRQFLRLIWAVDALQNERSEAALGYLDAVPPAAITSDIASPHAVRSWELETLANELLATPKDAIRLLDCRSWETVAELVNLLRALENAEYGARQGAVPILREMYRIGGRQFEWQRGFFSVRHFYRYVFIYGQGACAEYFQEVHSVTIPEMTMMGFALMAAFLEHPNYDRRGDLAIIGITPETRERVLSLVAAPLPEVRALAATIRAEGAETAYRPSVLRRFPCIAVGHRGRHLLAPIPQLIIARVTSGLFYDVVGGGGRVREDYGRRFETYARRHLDAALPELGVIPEWRYGPRRGAVDTPDLLCPIHEGEEIAIAIECKATRMSIAARFDDAAVEEQGYEEMARAVFQLWRFFSHCRRGLTGRAASADAVGIVLTLDDWLVMGLPLQEDVLARAEVISRQRDPEITADDRRTILFVSMADLERLLVTATPATFRAAVALAVTDNRRGWLLSQVHLEVAPEDAVPRPFPFNDDIGELMPWWAQFADEAAEHDMP